MLIPINQIKIPFFAPTNEITFNSSYLVIQTILLVMLHFLEFPFVKKIELLPLF